MEDADGVASARETTFASQEKQVAGMAGKRRRRVKREEGTMHAEFP